MLNVDEKDSWLPAEQIKYVKMLKSLKKKKAISF